jgi:signal transduction histidine kinase
VRNASDAGADLVTIRGRRTEAGARVTVTDDGPGLPDAVLSRLDGEKETPGGSSGLGLMIASELARGHGGTLTVEDTGPGGTIFRLDLPDQH